MGITGAQQYLSPQTQTVINLKHKSIQLSNISVFTKPQLLSSSGKQCMPLFLGLPCFMGPGKWSPRAGNHLFCTYQAVLTLFGGGNPDQGRLFCLCLHQNHLAGLQMTKQPDDHVIRFLRLCVCVCVCVCVCIQGNQEQNGTGEGLFSR